MKDNEQFRKDFFAFLENRGYVWGPFPEIYGGAAGFYAYGPLGKLLKNKVENSIRKIFTENSFWEVDCPLVLPDVVWKASGHLDTFVDKTIECLKCKSVFRVDKLIEEVLGKSIDFTDDKKLLRLIEENEIKCPNCKGNLKLDIGKYSLMMKTVVGGSDFSLRPETATVTYLLYKRYLDLFRKKLPFMVFQIGKAFRNEVSPRQHLIRCREFTQAEGQIFIDPKEKNNWEKFNDIKNDKLPLIVHNSDKVNEIKLEDAVNREILSDKAYAWCLWIAYNIFRNMGIPKERIRLRQHKPEERAFYANDAWDIEINLNSFGWIEVCGVHDRSDYDLKQHEKFSKQDLSFTSEDKRKFHPHILEIAFGTDRPVFALLDIFYEKKDVGEGKSLFNVPYNLAPVDVAVFPLMKKDDLDKKAKEVKKILEKEFNVFYDESGSIGKRYLRSMEFAIPYSITVDYDSLKNNDVTLRDRNTSKQIRVKINEMKDKIEKLIDGELEFEKAGKIFKN